ncbi:hypothetical protein M3Y99_01677900 [Aphelenchoides fujianensis]|nr:hypothetical protein M3Y99_01677900 [Aphelenchoides fujianensis]
MMQEQDEQIAKRSLNGILSNFDYQKKELSQRHLKELRTVVRKNEKVIPRFVDRLFEDDPTPSGRNFSTTFRISSCTRWKPTRSTSRCRRHLEAAASLKRETLKIVKSWIDKFSVGYQKLKTAAQFLTKSKNFDFSEANEQLLDVAAGKAGEADVQLHGYKENDHLTVVIPTAEIDIEETPNNAALVEALRDSQVLLRKKLTQAGAVAENAALIRRLLELKAEVGHELKRADQLRIKKTKRRSSGAAGDGSDSESEDEFEDIDSLEKRGKRKSAESTPSPVDPDVPGPSGLNASGSRKKEDEPQKPKIPKLQFGLDLKYWGQEIELATVVRNEFDGHAFWRAPDRDGAGHRARGLIKHKCRAPLPSGKLCPRMDLKVCPFHGPIVPRDEMGFPVEELGKGSLLALKSAEERIRKHMEQDEKDYVQDVEAAVGLPLAANEKKKRGAHRNKAYGTARKREKTQTELSRERLQTKLFSKSAMKRVTDTLTTIQKERAEKNFSNQFNYALTRRLILPHTHIPLRCQPSRPC